MSQEVDEPLQAHRELSPAVVARQLVNLVDDEPPQRPELIADMAAGEQDLERLRGRDEDVRRVAGLLGPLLRGRVPVADGDANAELLAEERHSAEHVSIQGSQRSDVQTADRLRLLR